jgi:hypothetical protein
MPKQRRIAALLADAFQEEEFFFPKIALVKAPEGAQAVLVECNPERFFVPPYVGHKGWIGLHLDGPRLDWDGVHTLIRQSYRLIAPKRLATQVDAKPPRR